MTNPRTHYDNLQVSRQASPEVIRAAYKSLVQKWHPDRHPGQRQEAERVIRIISQAFEVLSDPARRQQHDAWIAGHYPSSTGGPSPRQTHKRPYADARVGTLICLTV